MANRTQATQSLAELKALSKVIQDSIDSMESTLTENNMTFPSSTTPMTMESEKPRRLPLVDKSCSLIVSAAYQLVFAARSPLLSMMSVAMQYNLSAALSFASHANAVEACREAGPQGLHVKDIAAVRNVDPSKLARILRLLATHHIFLEVAPDVFANNRVSSTMDTGKSIKELKENPGSKHIGTNGLAASVEHVTDTTFKTAGYLADVLLDPKYAFSEEADQTARNVAMRDSHDAWDWINAPGNEHRLLRFGIAMEGAKRAAPPTAILEGFDWAGLKEDSLVVDVGGGIGSQSMTLAQTYPHLKFVVQDREEVMKSGQQYWDGQLPGALSSGRVKLQAHDFFAEQPIRNADVFLMRNIIHDWSDKYCITILRRLREAAAPSTRLVIVDSLIGYACPEETVKDIPGAQRPQYPEPLLANEGHANAISYFEDIMMLETMNGKERTITEVRGLLEQTGWKLVGMHLGAASAFSTQKAIAVPA